MGFIIEQKKKRLYRINTCNYYLKILKNSFYQIVLLKKIYLLSAIFYREKLLHLKAEVNNYVPE
jgi:hypothetical protein